LRSTLRFEGRVSYGRKRAIKDHLNAIPISKLTHSEKDAFAFLFTIYNTVLKIVHKLQQFFKYISSYLRFKGIIQE